MYPRRRSRSVASATLRIERISVRCSSKIAGKFTAAVLSGFRARGAESFANERRRFDDTIVALIVFAEAQPFAFSVRQYEDRLVIFRLEWAEESDGSSCASSVDPDFAYDPDRGKTPVRVTRIAEDDRERDAGGFRCAEQNATSLPCAFFAKFDRIGRHKPLQELGKAPKGINTLSADLDQLSRLPYSKCSHERVEGKREPGSVTKDHLFRG